MRTSVWILTCCLALAGCDETGGDEETTAEEPEAVEPEEVGGETTVDGTQTVDVEEESGYSLHEWGLIDIDLGEGEAEYAAGPGHAAHDAHASGSSGSTGGSTGSTGSNSTTGTRRRRDVVDQALNTANDVLDVLGGSRPNNGARRKPVLYFHLADTAADFTFDLSVNLGTGNVIEHFPAGTTEEHQVSWTGVGLASDSCAGGPYPSEDSEICTGVSDGYCEAAELASYVAADAGCLTHGGAQHNFLFYRGDGPIPTLPLTITRSSDGTVTIRNDSMGTPVGELLRLRRDGDAINVSQVAIPSQGQSVSLGQPADPATDSHREMLRSQLGRIGLTEPEAEAFARAWFGELFDAAAETPHAFPDAVLFFLPAESVDGFAHLEATPAPTAMVRAMAVRAGWTSR